MSSDLPTPKFERFERVVVDSDQPRLQEFVGSLGTVLWRDAYRQRRDGKDRRGWLYLVYFSNCGSYVSFHEVDLRSAFNFDHEAAHLGRRPEISFDLVMEENMSFIEGTYRLPGKFWEVMVFAKKSVPELRHELGRWDSGISGIVVHVPLAVNLNRRYALEAMSQITGVNDWVEIRGPDSMILR